MTAAGTGLLDTELAAVDALIRRRLASDLPLMRDVCDYVFESGGKRLRPGLALMCGRMMGADDAALLPAAAAVEMIHTATLLHDDIMDASPMRRGRLTVSRRWDPVVAVYAGDYVLSRAFTLLVGYGRSDILDVFSEVTSRFCLGEVLQARHRRDLEITVEDYLRIIDCKTAHFLSACCRVGGMVAGAPEAALDALSRFGTQIGLVFQVTDDLLDYVGETGITGKDVGADYREGKYTLPILMALQSEDASGRLRDLLQADPSDAIFRRVRSVVVACGAVDRAREFAEACTQSAIEALSPLPETPERDALRRLAIWIASRKT